MNNLSSQLHTDIEYFDDNSPVYSSALPSSCHVLTGHDICSYFHFSGELQDIHIQVRHQNFQSARKPS